MKGRVLVVGGSEEFVGAPYLAAMAALRAGAESVIVMAPEKVAWALNALSPDLMTRKLKGKYLASTHAGTILKQLKTADILVIGNGAGTRPGTASLMRSLMRWPGLKVVDADALKVLRGGALRNAILTPNEGEWKSLVKYIRKLAAHNVIVKKSARTEILSGNKKFRMKNVNESLSKAGMGDVLAGLCAACLTQGLTPLAAARTACKTGNQVADILTRKKKGYYFLASDLVAEIKKSHRLIRTNSRIVA